LKIAVTGKGGVGKTTLTSLLAYAFIDQGFRVLAIDADPSPCLGQALGFPQGTLAGLQP
jgi:CO dehydrogenase maturation factor